MAPPLIKKKSKSVIASSSPETTTGTAPMAEEDKHEELTEKEAILTKHLEKVTEELEKCKVRVSELQNFNKWLEDEAVKTRIESHEYINYMGKKTDKRQMAVISLSDHNREIINKIREEKKELEEEYEDKKKDLEIILLGKRHVLEKTKLQMNELNACKVLREEQLNEISELEDEVVKTRNSHAKTIQTLKENFLRDKEKFRQNAEMKIRTLQQEANKEASRCLADYTQDIKSENSKLRKQLLDLLQKNHSLLMHQRKLETQQQELVQEQQYAADLKKIRGKKIKEAQKEKGQKCGHSYPEFGIKCLPICLKE